jgi:hypothetical protein
MQNLLRRVASYERNRSFPWFADCVVHDCAAPLETQNETSTRGGRTTKDVPALRIDHISPQSQLPGMWQDLYSGCVLDFKEMKRCVVAFPRTSHQGDNMKNIKFVVKVTRGTRAPEYVQRVEPTPIHMTTNRKLALLMGKYTAEDAIKSLQNSHRSPELESVQVNA